MNRGGVLTQTLKTMRDQEMMMKTAPRITDAFHLCSDVPALCSHMYFFRYPQRSMNHREQFSLSVAAASETVFRLRVLCCPLSVGVVPQRRFSHQIPSTRLSEIQISPYAVINPEGLVSFESVDTMLPYELVARRHHRLPQRRDRRFAHR